MITQELLTAEQQEFSEYEEIIEKGLQTFLDVGIALAKIRDRRYYREQYNSFEAYCFERWGLSRRRAYQVMDAAHVVKNVQNFSQSDIQLPATESHAATLARLPKPEDQAAVWSNFVQSGDKLTAANLKTHVSEFKTSVSGKPDKDYKNGYGSQVAVEDDEYSAQDDCQTPPYALAAIQPFLHFNWGIAWEPATGEGLLAEAIRDRFHYQVMESGIKQNYFVCKPPKFYDVQITNPPWSKKFKWIPRAIEQGKPWALLVPISTISAIQIIRLIEVHELEIIHPYQRIDFKMPIAQSFEESRSHLDTVWLTQGFHIGERLTYVDIGNSKSEYLASIKGQ